MNFSAKSCKICFISWKSTKTHRFGQEYATFSNKLPCFGVSRNLSAKGIKKWLNLWKSTKNHRFGQNFATFRTNYHVFAFGSTFQEKVKKSASFREKHEKPSIWPTLCNFSNKLPCLCISINFSGKSCKKCLISWKSTKNHRSGQNFATFRTNYHVFAFRLTFQEKVAKSASFGEKTRKTIDLAKTCNFSSKLPCLGIFVYFSERSCKKCLIPWKSTRNHRFCQHYATFRTNYHVFAFRWTFKEKVGESGSFREKARKIMDLVKTCNFSNKLPCFGVSMNFSDKRLQKVPHFVKKHEKLIDLAKTMQLFRTNYHVLVFRWTFQQKVAKSASFREKAREIIDLAKTLQLFEQLPCLCISMNFSEKKLQKVPHFVKKHEKSSIWPKLCNFSNKLPCLCISMNFSAKGCKKCLISWKSTRNHRSGQNFATFRTTTMSLHFDELFRKKLQKVPHLVKKHEKSSIWPTLYNFSNKLPCLCISMNFSEKSCKKCLISWKNTKNHRFGQNYATFSNKLPCFRVAMNFSAKGCKKLLNSWKSTKYHRFGQNFTTFPTTTMSLDLDELLTKKLQKVPHFVKKHEKSSIWPNLYNFSNKLPCLCISMNFSEKRCKKCLISWKSARNHRSGQTLQLFEQTTMSLHFDQLFRKKLQKVPHLVKKHEKPSIWPKLAIFRGNYDVLAFSWTFQKEVAKSASFREKAREIIDFAKNCKFSKKLPSFFVSMNFMAKSCKNCLISWKSTKTHRFGQNYATFSNKLPCFGVSMNFWAKGCKKSLNSWESTKNHGLGQNFATFRTNYHVFAFGSTFQEKVAKSSSFREKPRKLIDLAKTFHFSSKLPCLGILMNF